MLEDKDRREIIMGDRPPSLKEFLFFLIGEEIKRIDYSKNILKKARKDYIKLHNIVKVGKSTEDIEEKLKDFPDLLGAYDKFLANDYEKLRQKLDEKPEEDEGVKNED